jgi:hypothetical protein
VLLPTAYDNRLTPTRRYRDTIRPWRVPAQYFVFQRNIYGELTRAGWNRLWARAFPGDTLNK